MLIFLLSGCVTSVQLGDIVVAEREDGGLDLSRYTGKPLVSDLRFAVGAGTETYEMQAGSYRLLEGETTWESVKLGNRRGEGLWLYDLLDDAGDIRGQVAISPTATNVLNIEVMAVAGNRVRFDAACTGNDHFVGGGEHAMDVDHVGEAFSLWVSEPGIGKSTEETQPADWFITGTRHSSSYPDPFFIRPEPVGVLTNTNARVEVDLCTGDRWRFDVADSAASWSILDADTPLGLVRLHATAYGAPAVPPDWAFGAWTDAVRGADRVLAVAAELREAGASATVIWSEDWRGGEELAFGYHPRPEWAVDETLYPDPSGIDASLEALGFKWMAYFAPFLVEDTAAWDEAIDFAIRDDKGEAYTFLGPSLETSTTIDLTDSAAYDWAVSKMEACADIGFDGWMTDYGEWLPTDAELAKGNAEVDHAAWPVLWQQASAEALDGRDATFFARAGWTGSPLFAPVHWPGDQRTSFDADDGLPSVVPLTLGGSIAGVPFSGSDIAGYQSVGNEPSTKELWMRWVALGAFSPIMRTHHGAFSDDDWQFDSDAETLAMFAYYSQVHASLFPYLRGLAEEAATLGTPVVRPIFLHHPDEDWGRTDAWLLGPNLLVSPVLAADAQRWTVGLPSDTKWFDWWTGEAVGAGDLSVVVPYDRIPVFAPAGAIVPTFAEAPDSLVAGPLDGITTLAEADKARVIHVFAGAKGSFDEADGTVYSTDGVADASGETSSTLTSGTLTAGGLTLTVSGSVERAYTLKVWR
ncbi:hypothetical protein LBMAG42_37250 [Deltaproteobacteria bacterium]|nr:hypothetical protein LBMAG42_37250 [Deltaproteobacteria bacterium]